ncbi:unnamed protein product [Ceutorhynchus assimilis]|uniref:Uncharacterized protein n=1 Tax=Ceutorhynchus assimilis TaxID=467358 RepID=A0A9N9MCX3_9CUCU|nr:unnamed protein product [Ceutorhynchus assimilis]
MTILDTMGKKQLLVLVILSLTTSSLQDITDKNVDTQEESPLADVAKEILKEKNLENIGGMVNSFMQSGGAKQLMDGVLQNLATNENSQQLLEGLGNILQNVGSADRKVSQKKSNGDVNPMELLSGLGSLVGAMQGGGDGQANPAALLQGLGSILGAANGGDGNNAGDLIQGIGSLLGGASQKNNKEAGDANPTAALLQGLGSILGTAASNKEGGKGDSLMQSLGALMGGGEGGLNPELIGNMMNMFANSQPEAGEKRSSKRAEKKGKKPKKAVEKKISIGDSEKNAGDFGPGIDDRNKVKDEELKDGEKSIDDINSVESQLPDDRHRVKNQPTKSGDDIDSTNNPQIKNKKKGKKKSGSSFVNPLDAISKSRSGLDLAVHLENIPLYFKLAKSFGGPELKRYLDPVDDIMELYQDISKTGGGFDLSKVIKKLGKIYKAIMDIVIPLLPPRLPSSVDPSASSGDDFGNLVNMATNLLGQGQEDGNGDSNFMGLLPMIMRTIGAFTGEEAQARSGSHSEHSGILPPALEKVHVLYDIFMNSEMGKYVVGFVSNQKAFKLFQDENGTFSFDKFVEMIENHSFRRHWIQQVTNKLIQSLKLVSDEKTYKKYIGMGITFANSFLANSGFPKDTLIDMNKPAKSITNFANYAAWKFLDTKLDSAEYVEPFVKYTQDILKMAKSSIKLGTQNRELQDKLTDTINMEIIEPLTRVNRAYRFAKTQPQCDRYIFCLINEKEAPNEPGTLPTMKKALYKGTSLVATWFLTSHTKTSYWDLYEVIVNTNNCNLYYNDLCNGFYHEEIKATTEYVHNEL